MTTPFNYKYNYNRHQIEPFCAHWKPCKRRSCNKCQKRLRRQLISEVMRLEGPWQLKTFLTIGITRFSGTAFAAAQLLLKTRKAIVRVLFPKSHYICFPSISQKQPPTPHFHFITSLLELTDSQQNSIDKIYSPLKVKSNTKRIDCTDRDFKSVTKYCFNKNYLKSLHHFPLGSKIITGSTGFYITPRPSLMHEHFYELRGNEYEQK